ncbi:hypothetical protein PVAP13_7KG274710 [Panicum virgatum]|uniref:Legume lectin domain-containing protein n=1 Tax=Panicum virgatum TaxID=38727 RepID=A0A8T0QNZ8_PANVG|nr:hypothetical protein PVAP13_7KG274710 [Panicum virgatum]
MHRRPCSLLHRLLLLLLLLLLAPLLLSVSAIGKHEFIYHGFSGNNLTMDGDASVFDGLLRLTSGKAHETGHAFYPYPLNFTDAAAIVPNNNSSSPVPSFSTTFVFAINSAYPDGLASDGLAFVLSYTTELYTTGSAGQFLGLLNQWNNGNSSNRLLAIELDTIQNTEFGDIDGNHIGIDVNSLRSNSSHTAGLGGLRQQAHHAKCQHSALQPILNQTHKVTAIGYIPSFLTSTHHHCVCWIFLGDWHSSQQALHPRLELQTQRRSHATQLLCPIFEPHHPGPCTATSTSVTQSQYYSNIMYSSLTSCRSRHSRLSSSC